MDKPTIFISYSHKDEVWKDRLSPHLQALELDDRIVVWDDRKIDVATLSSFASKKKFLLSLSANKPSVP